jgi:hypothetical protein
MAINKCKQGLIIQSPLLSLDCFGHAQNPFGQDHAPGAGAISNDRDLGDVMTLAHTDSFEEIKMMAGK